MSELAQVTIYTDGACSGNPGPGGWAVLLIFGKHTRELSGGEWQTTNNRMELTAALQAFQALKRPCRIDFYTDSTYLKQGITEWLPVWRSRNWKRKGGALANKELWQALDQAIQPHQINWQWVRGHAGDLYNERVDALARKAVPKRPD